MKRRSCVRMDVLLLFFSDSSLNYLFLFISGGADEEEASIPSPGQEETGKEVLALAEGDHYIVVPSDNQLFIMENAAAAEATIQPDNNDQGTTTTTVQVITTTEGEA